MNKHLLKALWAWTHPSLIQTVDQKLSGEPGIALDIRLLDQDENGNTTSTCETRYVRISDSSGGDVVYPLCLENGEAYLRLEDLNGVNYTLVQCDENGNQLMNGDLYATTYTVNGAMQQEDYARIAQEYGACQQIEVINLPKQPVTLHIVKALENEFQEPIDFDCDMCFEVNVSGCGFCKTVILNMENQFHAVLENLRAGMYELSEVKQDGYRTQMRLDDEPLCSETAFLTCGTHHLEVVNRRYTGSVLTIDKFIRCENGELIKPHSDAVFRIQVISDRYEECFVLDRENDFTLELCDLPQGCYDIRELNTCGYEVSYMVNDCKESSYANVEIGRCTHAAVMIINRTVQITQESPLRICKYVRGNDGCLVKPDAKENFKVMLSGCGVCEIFNLNIHNNFCVDIEHICCGAYEVKELDHCGYVASYIVNDGCESTSADLWIHENCTNCVTIINEARNQGRITISKVIRQSDGSLVKPEKSARFVVTLRSVFGKESYVLDNDNDFCVHIQHLREGSYEVKERCTNGYETTYMVDGAAESKKARFTVTNDSCSDIKVINGVKKEISGDLRITKYIANAYGDYVKPSADEEFKVHVEGPDFDQCYTLRAANSWCIILEGLKKGVYRINEQAQSHYDTRYYVNECETAEALVKLDHHNQEVAIVNTRRSFGNIKLNVQVQNCDGSLRKPNRSEFFEVILESGEGSRELRFDESNNFGMVIEDLPFGKARITQKDNYGYRVIYDVNGKECNHASVMMEGSSASITIINQMMDCSGILRVRKLVRTLGGRLITPCDEDCYEFTLKSRCLDRQYALNEKNHFCVLFDDLEQGEYELKESYVHGMKTEYRINGKTCERGSFVLANEDINVDIINTVLPLPKLTVHKRIRKGDVLLKPQPQEVFHFVLIGRGVHETYCLNRENDWCVTIEDLNSRHYEIRELNSEGNVCYQINDTCFDQGTFLFDECDVEVTIINDAPSEALVRIAKMMVTIDGETQKPCRGEHFEIVLESDCSKHCFTLDERNDWCVEIEGLPEGVYTVGEHGCENYDVMINGGKVLNREFKLKDNDIDIMIYNHLGCENAMILQAHQLIGTEAKDPDSKSSYHVHVVHDDVCDDFILNKDNDWCMKLCDIMLGQYQIYADETMLYEACGNWFENSICIDMGCGEITVNLYEECKAKRNITITKRMIDANGKETLPEQQAEFEVMLLSHVEQCFTLNKENDWTVQLNDCACGSYEVVETGCREARYRINDGALKDCGCFTLENEPVKVTIVNPCDFDEEVNGGSVLIHALVKNCDGLLETAAPFDRFEVMLDGEHVQEDMILTERGGFQRRFDHLPKGTYTVTQQQTDPYTHTMYRINGQEASSGVFTLGEEPLQVDLINYLNCVKGNIHVMKYKKDASCGCLKRPSGEESYDISIKGENRQETAVLNASNNWSYTFADLPAGTYIIEESGGQATYIINGGKEQKQAAIEVSGQDYNVKVINEQSQESFGSIELCKYVRDENGQDHSPDPKSNYWISVRGNDDVQHILLHAANHFYAQLNHLRPGIYEVSEDDGENVLYSVNGSKETASARVNVQANHNSVDIINRGPAAASITLSKMLQQDDGTLSVPKSGAYRIHVSAPGYNKVVTLDQSNQYSAVLVNLKHGLYVIDELDHEDVTYIVDQGSMVDRAVVHAHSAHDVLIINPDREQSLGSVTLTKYIRNNNGQLMTPPNDAAYEFHIQSRNFHQNVTLNRDNRWMATWNDLASGDYTISENGPANVSYKINDGEEQTDAVIAVNNDQNYVTAINHAASSGGQLTITKYIRDENLQLLKPTGAYEVQVHVSKPGYNELFTLNRENNWEVTITDLANGEYVLNEINARDDVTWQIDGGYEVRYGIVSVHNDAHQAVMINQRLFQTSNVLRIQKLLRSDSGQLTKPNAEQRFTVFLTGAEQRRLLLSVMNNWTEEVKDLPNGAYELNEASESYQVSYQINEQEERPNAMFILQDSEVNVNVINSSRSLRGRLELTAFVKNGNGTIIEPAAGDTFTVTVSSNELSRSYILDEENGFRVQIDDLPDNMYTVIQTAPLDQRVTYRVNGNEESQTATVNLKANTTNTVAIINAHEDNQNIVDVSKYMLDEQGNYRKPDSNQIFRFLLSGNNVHQFYTLSSDNDWHVRIDTLNSGEYEIREENNGNYEIKYQVNGSALSRTAMLNVTSGSENTVEIINIDPTKIDGKIVLAKKLRDETGNLVTPSNGEGFMIRIWNTISGYDEIFTLDQLNGYSLIVSSLQRGTYQIQEVDTSDYGVTYQVNGGAEGTTATVPINDASENNVVIINTRVSLFYRVDSQDDLRIVIE